MEPSSSAANPTLKPDQRSPSTAPAPSGSQRLERDTIAITLVDGLRVRSLPEVSARSKKYEPLVENDRHLFVLSGPVARSGYEWYEVAPIDAPGFERRTGWVAAASRDSVPWIAPGSATCPAMPSTFAQLDGLTFGGRLACFPNQPLTVEARLVPCYCDIDAGVFSPAWFGFGNGQPLLLVAPTTTRAPDDVEDWNVLHLDPAGVYSLPLPIGEAVTVTGVFDHPAARACTFKGLEESVHPTNQCRFAFAVTRIE